MSLLLSPTQTTSNRSIMSTHSREAAALSQPSKQPPRRVDHGNNGHSSGGEARGRLNCTARPPVQLAIDNQQCAAPPSSFDTPGEAQTRKQLPWKQQPPTEKHTAALTSSPVHPGATTTVRTRYRSASSQRPGTWVSGCRVSERAQQQS
jgi:hypothetical protein